MWANYSSFFQLSFHVLDKHQLVNSLDSHFVHHYRDTWSWLRAPDHILSVGFWERMMMMMMMMMVNHVRSVVRQTWVRTELLSLEKNQTQCISVWQTGRSVHRGMKTVNELPVQPWAAVSLSAVLQEVVRASVHHLVFVLHLQSHSKSVLTTLKHSWAVQHTVQSI